MHPLARSIFYMSLLINHWKACNIMVDQKKNIRMSKVNSKLIYKFALINVDSQLQTIDNQ